MPGKQQRPQELWVAAADSTPSSLATALIRLRRENELQQQTVEELIVRRQKQKSLVTKLHERVTELEAASVEADRKRDTKVSTQEKHMLALQKQLEEAKQAEGSVRSELKQATRRIAAVLKEKERMMALQDDTVRFLMQAVNDLQVSHVDSAGHSRPPFLNRFCRHNLLPLTRLHCPPYRMGMEGKAAPRDWEEKTPPLLELLGEV